MCSVSICRCGRATSFATPFHQILYLTVAHAPLGAYCKRFTSIYAIHGAAKVSVHRLFQVKHWMSIGGCSISISAATATTTTATSGCRAGGIATTVVAWRTTAWLLWSLPQQTAMRRLFGRQQQRGRRWWWLQIFGIYGKVVAGYGINCSGVDHLRD